MKIFKYLLVSLNLIIFIGLNAQDVDLPRKIQRNLAEFYLNEKPLTIYLDFNQPAYSPGDTAFFKAYILEHNGQPAAISKVSLRTSVFDEQGRPVILNRTLLQDDMGQGQLIVPVNCSPGRFLLLATIDGQTQYSTSPYFKTSFVVVGEKLLTISPARPRLFAEGGSLIVGLAGKVVALGLDTKDSVYIRDDNDRRIDAIKPSSSIGVFSVTPALGRTYFLQTRNHKLPIDFIKKDGIALTIQNSEQGAKVQLAVSENSGLRDEEFFLILSSRDRVCKTIPVSFGEAATANFSLTNKFCTSGVAQATLLTKSGEVLAQRLLALKRPGTNVEINLDRTSVETREKIKAAVMMQDDQGSLLSGSASVTVYKKGLFATGQRSIFTDYVSIASDVLSPDGYDLSSGDYSDDQIDNILIASRNKTFSMEDIVNYVPVRRKFEGPVFFKGRLIDRDGPVKDSTYITFWLNENDFIYGVYTTGGNGNFSFPLFKNFTDDHALYIATYKGKRLKNVSIELGDDLTTDHIENTVQLNGAANPYYSFSEIRKLVAASFNYFLTKAGQQNSKKTAELIETDFTVDLQKFKPFSSVKELLGEVVPMVKVKKSDGVDVIRMFIQGTSRFATGSPLFVIDGVLTDSSPYLLNMTPSDILTIGVINTTTELGRYGMLGKNGILVITTASPETTHLALNNAGTLSVKGIDQPISFREKRYTSASRTKVPDLRSTLYWNPFVKIDASGKAQFEFYAADGIGEYVIRVTGITHEGLAFEAYQTFNVLPSKSN